MKDNKFWIIVSGISGFLAVALGAFGAHSAHPRNLDVLDLPQCGGLGWGPPGLLFNSVGV